MSVPLHSSYPTEHKFEDRTGIRPASMDAIAFMPPRWQRRARAVMDGNVAAFAAYLRRPPLVGQERGAAPNWWTRVKKDNEQQYGYEYTCDPDPEAPEDV
jgi:hypothetical protein